MKLKKRLIINNTVTVVIPLIITAAAAFIFVFVSSNFFNRNIGYDNFKKLIKIKAELFNESQSITAKNPEIVESKDFQQYLSERISSLNGKVIIAKNHDIIFSSKDLNKIDIEKCMENVDTPAAGNTIEINNTSYIYQANVLKFQNGTSGNVILLAPLGTDGSFASKFILVTILTFIISFIAVNIFMSYMFSKRILRPVSQLKKAASEISSGNLDYEIAEYGDEEIKELCHDFEIMRLQLKDSVHLRMQYDDNRKILISSISHDLKTPITSIEGYVEGILDGIAKTPEKVETYLKTIYSKAKYMDVMIDDLLLYSKLELKQIPFNFEKVDIVEYLSYCVYECAPELEKSNIKIRLQDDLRYSKYVMLDRERMKRVILNIIDNSRKYMDKEQGEISLMLRETNLCIIIEISDNGCGIDKNQAGKIFDRFYRTDSARSGAKGSGLGLAIAKQIVEGHRGRIWCIGHESEGTSIMISLEKMIGE